MSIYVLMMGLGGSIALNQSVTAIHFFEIEQLRVTLLPCTALQIRLESS